MQIDPIEERVRALCAKAATAQGPEVEAILSEIRATLNQDLHARCWRVIKKAEGFHPIDVAEAEKLTAQWGKLKLKIASQHPSPTAKTNNEKKLVDLRDKMRKFLLRVGA